MIPACIDYGAIIEDLVSYGFGPYKIDVICGFAMGATMLLRTNQRSEMCYSRAARLYNFWWDERSKRGLHVYTSLAPLFPDNCQAAHATT